MATESGSISAEAAIDRLRAVGDGMIGAEWRQAVYNSYILVQIQNSRNSLLTLRIFVCRNSWHRFAEPFWRYVAIEHV
jgi:hypothetical protein